MTAQVHHVTVTLRNAMIGPVRVPLAVIVPPGPDEQERLAICARVTAAAMLSLGRIGIG